MKQIGVWWSTGPAPGNFGDILTPLILSYYGIDHRLIGLSQAKAISTGSTIRFALAGMDVLGSGAMFRDDRINPKARIVWVRGPITGELVKRNGLKCPDVYGDPAVLLPKIYPRNVDKSEEVGYFLHYRDLGMKPGYVINPLAGVPEVLRRLWACKQIVSSSLHGIIAAHAYGIPAAWVKLSKLDGDDTKFHDYAQSVGLREMPLSTIEHPRFTLPEWTNHAFEPLLLEWKASLQ